MSGIVTTSLTDQEVERLKKLLPWLDNMLDCDRDPARCKPGAKDPPPTDKHTVGWSRHPGLTFGDLRELRKLIHTL